MREIIRAKDMPAIMLTRDCNGLCVVSVEVVAPEGCKWVPVIQDNGEVIHHTVTRIGVELAIKREFPHVAKVEDSEETLS